MFALLRRCLCSVHTNVSKCECLMTPTGCLELPHTTANSAASSYSPSCIALQESCIQLILPYSQDFRELS
jgi:hypothetical protein